MTKGNAVVPGVAREDNSVDLARSGQDNSVDPIARLVRAAIDESGWKHDAVAEAMGLKGESGKSYLSKMLAGEKPISARHLVSLPDDIEAIFARKYAETFNLVVVTPVFGEAAVRSLMSGLLGVLAPAPALPDRAAAMAKADLSTTIRKVVGS